MEQNAKTSDDGFRSGCRNVSQHQQQSSGLHYKPGRSLKPQGKQQQKQDIKVTEPQDITFAIVTCSTTSFFICFPI